MPSAGHAKVASCNAHEEKKVISSCYVSSTFQLKAAIEDGTNGTD